ncbi:MAG: hypothetical protein KDE48_13795, partial [Anaerolineales bacterium]|nr:hypothetical protein [Anaerolineales bacterium]
MTSRKHILRRTSRFSSSGCASQNNNLAPQRQYMVYFSFTTAKCSGVVLVKSVKISQNPQMLGLQNKNLAR